MRRGGRFVLGIAAVLTVAGASAVEPSRADGPAARPRGQVGAPPTDLAIVGQIGGASHAVAVQGTHAYLGLGPRLVVYDVRDPRVPQLVGESAPLPEVVVAVGVTGRTAIVAGDQGGLFSMDTGASGASPVVVNRWQAPERVHDIATSGTLAVLALGESGLQVIDAADPRAPVTVGAVDTPGDARSVAVAGDHAYVADYEAGLQVVDVTDPRAPRILGANGTMDVGWGVAVTGDRAFVIGEDEANNEGLMIFDVSRPDAPMLQHVVPMPEGLPMPEGSGPVVWLTNGLAGVDAAGTAAYVAGRSGDLWTVDVRPGGRPSVVGTTRLTEWAGLSDVTVANGHVFAAAMGGGLLVADVRQPETPALAAEVDVVGASWDVALDGPRAYSVSPFRGLQVVDVIEPSQPRLKGSTTDVLGTLAVLHAGDVRMAASVVPRADVTLQGGDAPSASRSTASACSSFGYSVDAAGEVAFVGNGQSEVYTVDASQPASPRVDSFMTWLPSPQDVVSSGDRLFVAAGDSGLKVFDARRPASPSLIGEVPVSDAGCASSVAVEASHAYLADWNGVHVVDVGPSSEVRRVGGFERPGAFRVAAVGDRLVTLAVEVFDFDSHTTHGANEMLVTDVRDPAAPRITGVLPLQEAAYAVAAASDTILLGGLRGVRVVDAGVPGAPRIVGEVAIPGDVQALAIDGDHVYVSAGEGGLVVLGPAPAVPMATATAAAKGSRIAYLPVAITEHCPPIDIFADVVLVIDASTSMDERSPQGERKIDRAVAAARRFIDGLRLGPGRDQVSVVAFNESAEVRSTLTSDRAELDRALSNVAVRGQSRVELGIYRATLELLSPRHDPSRGNTRAILVLSDGMANPVPGSEAVKAAQDAKALGVLVYVVGVGPTMDRDVLTALASRVEYFWPAPDADWLPQVFADLVIHVACPKEIWWGRR